MKEEREAVIIIIMNRAHLSLLSDQKSKQLAWFTKDFDKSSEGAARGKTMQDQRHQCLFQIKREKLRQNSSL